MNSIRHCILSTLAGIVVSLTASSVCAQSQSTSSVLWEILVESTGTTDLTIKVWDQEADTLLETGTALGSGVPYSLSFEEDCCPDYDLPQNILVRLDFYVKDNEEAGTIRSFHYVYCDNGGPEDGAFYCPYANGEAADIFIRFDDTDWSVQPLGYYPDVYTKLSGPFVLPYDLETYCDGSPPDCTFGNFIDDVTWFLADGGIAPFTFTDADLVQPSSRPWEFRGVDVKLQAGRDISIPNKLDIVDGGIELTGNINLQSGSTSDWDGATIIGGTVNMAGTLTLDGTTTFDEAAFVVPSGKSVTLASGDAIVVKGTQSSPGQIVVSGTFVANVGSTIMCDGTYSEVMADGGTIDLRGDFDLDCAGARLLAKNGGTIKIGSDMTLSDGAFLSTSNGGTFEVEDDVEIDYQSTASPSFGGTTVFKMGDDARLVVSGAGVTFSGSVEFKRLGAYEWDRIEIRGDGVTFDGVDINGALIGFYNRGSNTTLVSSYVHDNEDGIHGYTDYSSGGNSSLEVGQVYVYDNAGNGLQLSRTNFEGDQVIVFDNGGSGIYATDSPAGDAYFLLVDSGVSGSGYNGVQLHHIDATMQGNEIYDNDANGVYAMGSYLTDTWENEIYSNDRGIYFYGTDTDADASFYRNYIHDNASYGVYVAGNSIVNAFDGSSRFSENGSHEVFVNGASARFYPSMGSPIDIDGSHDFIDTSMPGGTYLIANNVSGWTMPAEGNYWGTSSPTSSLFSGAVDYSPYLTTSPATGPGGAYRVAGIGQIEDARSWSSDKSPVARATAVSDDRTQLIKDAIIDLRYAIEVNENDPANGGRLYRLYDLLTFDGDDATGERAASMTLVNDIVAEYLASNRESRGTHSAVWALGEAALMIRTMENLRSKDYTSVAAAASLYRAAARTAAVQAELHVLESIALEHLGDLDGAITALESAESVAGGTVYAGEDFSREKQVLRELKADLSKMENPAVAAPHFVESKPAFVESPGESLAIFPNPVVDWLQYSVVDQSPGVATIRVYDIAGRTVASTTRTIESDGRVVGRVETSAWATGMYFIRVTGSDGSQHAGRFVKR